MTYTLDWSETNLGGSAVVSYGAGAILDFTDKPAGATAALSLTAHHGGSTNITIAEFSIETSGSSVMTFDYHTSTEGGYDKLHIDVDGVSQANYSGTTAWTSHPGINIASAGVHTIRFRYQKDAGSSLNADRVWVALLNITNTVTTNDASGTVTTYDMEDGSIPSVVTTSTWTNSTSSPIAGTRSLRSPASPAANGSYDLTIAKAAGSGYATVGFAYKTDSESGYDRLFVFPDATASNVPASGAPSADGASGWIDYSGSTSGRLAVILPAAAGTVLLRYTKDSGGDVGADAAWIDTLSMPAGGGGTNHTQTPTDTTGSTDTRAFAQGKAVTDASGLTDTATASVGRTVTATDTAGLTDSATLASGTGLTSSDAEALTDSTALARGTAVTDSSGLADATALARSSTVTDTTGLTDGVTIDATSSGGITQTDPAGLTDTTVTARGQVSTDAAGLADGASLSLSRATTDAASLTDSATVENGKAVTATDAAGLSDAVVIERFVAITDDPGLADLVALARAIVAADAAGLADSVGVALVPAGGLVTPAARTIVVPAESRTTVVPAESRVLTIPAENRTLEA